MRRGKEDPRPWFSDEQNTSPLECLADAATSPRLDPNGYDVRLTLPVSDRIGMQARCFCKLFAAPTQHCSGCADLSAAHNPRSSRSQLEPPTVRYSIGGNVRSAGSIGRYASYSGDHRSFGRLTL